MTRLQLENLVADWLNDPEKTYYTPTKIQARLNLAQKVTQFLLIDAYQDFYTVCATASTVASQERYLLPSDFMKLRKLEIITQGSGDTATKRKLEPMDLNQTDQVFVGPDQPWHYFLTKNHVHLRPIPQLVQTLEMSYIYRVADIASDSAEPDVPEEYHEFLAVLAVEDNLIKDGADLAALLKKKDYYENKIEVTAANRKPDGARMITTTRGGFGAA